MTAAVEVRERAGAVPVLVTSLVLGATADALLRAGPWGVGVTIGATLLAAAGAILVQRHRRPSSADAAWVGVTIVLLAAAFSRRDSMTLQALDLLALTAAFGAVPLALA